MNGAAGYWLVSSSQLALRVSVGDEKFRRKRKIMGGNQAEIVVLSRQVGTEYAGDARGSVPEKREGWPLWRFSWKPIIMDHWCGCVRPPEKPGTVCTPCPGLLDSPTDLRQIPETSRNLSVAGEGWGLATPDLRLMSNGPASWPSCAQFCSFFPVPREHPQGRRLASSHMKA